MTVDEIICRVRELAKQVGYAIGVHGTLERDIDLIAVPWTDEAVGNYELIKHLCEQLPAIRTQIDRKPHGRYGFVLQGYGRKYLDISVVGGPVDRRRPKP